jgi:hypothetical protein
VIRNYRAPGSSQVPLPSSAVAWLTVLVLMAVSSGCGEKTDAVPVTGKVSYKGEPLKTGTVMLVPEGGGAAATGEIQADGTFKLTTFSKDDGAVPGDYKVMVQVFPEPDAGGGLPGMEFGNEKPPIPEKYMDPMRTDLTATIKDSDNNLDLQLTD